MIRTALMVLLSHWLRHPLQLAMLVLGLALATGLWSGVQAINAEARAAYDRAAGVLGQDQLDRLVPKDGTLSVEEFASLRRAGWPVSPVLEGRVDGLRILGIDPLTLPRGAAVPGLPGLEGAGLTDFLGGRLVFVDPDLLDRGTPPAPLNGLAPEPAADLPPMTVLA
ncbi:MAG: hypothetical protein B7Z31_15695, partial [Rhodobacterales bacterium 12-65-15]